jgi:hypothetical protein
MESILSLEGGGSNIFFICCLLMHYVHRSYFLPFAHAVHGWNKHHTEEYDVTVCTASLLALVVFDGRMRGTPISTDAKSVWATSPFLKIISPAQLGSH